MFFRKKSLESDLLPLVVLDFDKEKATPQIIDSLFNQIIADGNKAAKWYFEKRLTARFWGRTLRIFSILSAALASITPTVSSITAECKLTISAEWSTIFIVVSGVFIATDKLYGHTSSWVRYIQYGQKIKQTLEKFQTRYLLITLSWKDTEYTQEQLNQAISLCQELQDQLLEHIQNETAIWSMEFQKIINENLTEFSSKKPDENQ